MKDFPTDIQWHDYILDEILKKRICRKCNQEMYDTGLMEECRTDGKKARSFTWDGEEIGKLDK